ncbi:hypothetical protein ACFWUZ_20290 [Streptomyces sp. NPDC058646]|uniref:hypothetical protein n=1 Tax=Streptomyces sp. NPDC058646 TaxID=3346574 RepID=UPI003669B790
MSTPEEQQNQQQPHQQQPHQQNQQQSHQQQPHQQDPHQQDPYGTQTWQAETWETGYQPVHPPLGSVPGQPVAPEGWFRDEPPAPAVAPAEETAYLPPYPGSGQQQPVAPDGWFREEAPAPAPAPAQDWSRAGYPTPYGEQAAPAAVPAEETAYLPPYPGSGQQQPAVPDGWFRDEAPAPAPAPVQDWSRGGVPWPDAPAAEQTAYLPPQTPAPAPAAASAEETAYLPPYRGQAAPAPASAEETAYLPPYREQAAPAPAPASAEETAYLPPYRGQAAPAPAPAAAEETAYLPPYREQAAPAPAPAAAEETAYLPPYREHAAPAPAPASAPQPAGAEPGEEPAWSPPTLAGNTIRAVDPAQARAEGLSPIIDPGPQPALLTAALGVLLAVAAAVGQYALLVPLIALQGLTAAGWFRLNGMWPARQGIALAFLGALVADAAVLAVDRTHGPGAIIGTLGAWVLLTLVLQLRSHADPDERMYGLMASVASAALAIVCAGYLAAGSQAVTVGGVAVAAAVFARALPLPPAPSVGAALASAAGAGIAVGGLTVGAGGGALLGLVAGVCALVGLRVAAYDYPSKFVHMTAGVALPLAAAAPAVYLIGRVVG